MVEIVTPSPLALRTKPCPSETEWVTVVETLYSNRGPEVSSGGPVSTVGAPPVAPKTTATRVPYGEVGLTGETGLVFVPLECVATVSMIVDLVISPRV